MAQSMYEIIETGKIEVNHNGEDVTFNLPEWLKNAAGKLENAEALLAWAKEYEIIHALLHAGISDTIIGLRAAIRPAGKKDKDGNMIPVSLVKDEIKAQERANEFVIKPKARPGTGGSGVKNKAEIDTLTKVCKAMREAGLTDEVIHSMQDQVFGKVKVSLALNNIEE
jgi:hypothetical protein